METINIEERAKDYDSQFGRCYNDEGAVDIETLYIEIATEQDRISRKDERELCRQICRDWIADYLEGEDMDSKSIDDAVEEFDIKFSKAIKLNKI